MYNIDGFSCRRGKKGFVRKKRVNRGYTLVEVLIAVALLGVIVSVGYAVYIMGVREYIAFTRRMDVQQNVRLAASFIQRRLLTAATSDVEERYVEGLRSLKIGDDCFNLKGDTLRFNMEFTNPYAPFNPLAEGISKFDFSIEGRRVWVVLAGGNEGQNDYFEVEFEVFLRQ